ncbi:MAG: hypothetical protein AAF911_06310 [Planctomycetota bacterium]
MTRLPKQSIGLVLALVLTIACLSGGLMGCEPKGVDRRPINPDTNAEAGWQPQAVALRIYPSTRFVREQGTPMLEARIEMFDQMGDSIKASGQLRFELFAAGSAPGIDVGRLLYSWDIGLMGLEEQQRYYDPITRAYLLRLRLDSEAITRREVLLRVTFQVGDETRLIDEQPVRINW